MRIYGIQTTVSMAKIAHSQRLLRVRLVCRGCKFRPFSHANSPRLSLVCVYAWRFWPIVSAFVFSQRQLSLSASMHNTTDDGTSRGKGSLAEIKCTGILMIAIKSWYSISQPSPYNAKQYPQYPQIHWAGNVVKLQAAVREWNVIYYAFGLGCYGNAFLH